MLQAAGHSEVSGISEASETSEISGTSRFRCFEASAVSFSCGPAETAYWTGSASTAAFSFILAGFSVPGRGGGGVSAKSPCFGLKTSRFPSLGLPEKQKKRERPGGADLPRRTSENGHGESVRPGFENFSIRELPYGVPSTLKHPIVYHKSQIISRPPPRKFRLPSNAGPNSEHRARKVPDGQKIP